MAATQPNIVALVDRMPATDKEKEAQKAPPPGQPPAQGSPRPAKPVASKFDAPDPEVMAGICAEILAGGPPALVELISLIRDPAGEDFKNYKAEYLCHSLTIQVGRPDGEQARRWVIDTLAGQAGNETLVPHTRGFLVRELQLLGDRAAVSALGRLLGDERFCDDAARTLLAITDGATEQFRKALPTATGHCRLVVLQSLAVLRDPASADAFLQAASDADREIRLAGLWGLARLGSPGAVEVLLKAAETQQPWERIKATQACLLLAENLVTAGRKTEAVTLYTSLRNTRREPKERYVRDLAAKALEDLQPGKKLT
jgi:HEAT repeat protein